MASSKKSQASTTTTSTKLGASVTNNYYDPIARGRSKALNQLQS